MVSSKAKTVEDYLDELPPDRRAVVSAVRDLVNANLPEGYVETMNWGMIAWEVPLSRYPVTYNKQPLGYVALAAQKNAYSLYLMESRTAQDTSRGPTRCGRSRMAAAPVQNRDAGATRPHRGTP